MSKQEQRAYQEAVVEASERPYLLPVDQTELNRLIDHDILPQLRYLLAGQAFSTSERDFERPMRNTDWPKK